MDRFELTAVTVRTFYGHPQTGIAAPDLGPGVNVVYGPNGQGKTTLARAIHGVLWPETVETHRPTYTAAFHFGGDDWQVDIESGVARYRRGGDPADRLPLPDKSYRDRYEFSLADLLLADGDSFADVVRRDAAGGVDLDAARERLGFKSAPTQRLKVTQLAEEAAAAVTRRQHELDALRRREQDLADLADRATEATDAAERAELYRLLEEAAAAAASAEAAARMVAAFPDALAAVAPDTQERYDDLGIAVRKAEARLSDVGAKREEARAALAEHGWDAVTLPEEAEVEGGYARALGESEQDRQLAFLARHIPKADVVITTAQIPGRMAPVLVTRGMVEEMTSGSVIVDLAGETGGNCELSEAGKTVLHGVVTIVSPVNLASGVAQHSSQMLGTNISALLKLLVQDGNITLDLSDDIVDSVLVTHEGAVRISEGGS